MFHRSLESNVSALLKCLQNTNLWSLQFQSFKYVEPEIIYNTFPKRSRPPFQNGRAFEPVSHSLTVKGACKVEDCGRETRHFLVPKPRLRHVGKPMPEHFADYFVPWYVF